MFEKMLLVLGALLVSCGSQPALLPADGWNHSVLPFGVCDLREGDGDRAPRKAAFAFFQAPVLQLFGLLWSCMRVKEMNPGASCSPCSTLGEAAANLLSFSSCDNEITYLF